MTLRKYHPETAPVEGDYKVVRRFAWWPKRVGDRLIWLQRYKMIYEYRNDYRWTRYMRGVPTISGYWCSWDLVQTKLCNP